MSRTKQVTDAIGTAIASYINTAGYYNPKAVVFTGLPTAENLKEIFAQGAYCVSIYPVPGTDMRPKLQWKPETSVYVAPNVTFTAAVSGGVITFSGTPCAGANIHVLGGSPEQDAFYQTTATDTLNSIATLVSASINGATSFTSVASGAAAVVAHPPSNLHVNIGGSGQLAQVARRIRKRVQVTVWAKDYLVRDSVDDIILSNLGTLNNKLLPLGDGTSVWVVMAFSTWSDDPEVSDLMYRGIYIVEAEYSLLTLSSATQIGAIKTTYTYGPNANSITQLDG